MSGEKSGYVGYGERVGGNSAGSGKMIEQATRRTIRGMYRT
jgi:hypothetical protein